MLAICTRVTRLARARLYVDEQGATAIEYGLIASLVCIVLVAGLLSLQGSMERLYELVDAVQAVM